MLFDGIVPWIVADAAESQLAPGQSLERLEGDLASWFLMIQPVRSTLIMMRRIESQR